MLGHSEPAKIRRVDLPLQSPHTSYRALCGEERGELLRLAQIHAFEAEVFARVE
jgi:hypothetical protein